MPGSESLNTPRNGTMNRHVDPSPKVSQTPSGYTPRHYTPGQSTSIAGMTPRVKAHMERLREQAAEEDEILREQHRRRNEARDRAREAEKNYRLETAQKIQAHQHRSDKTQALNQTNLMRSQRIQRERLNAVRATVNAQRVHRRNWEQEFELQLQDEVMEKAYKQQVQLRSKVMETAKKNSERRERLERNRQQQLAAKEEAAQRRAEAEAQRMAAATTTEKQRRDHFLARKHEDTNRKKDISRRQQEQLNQRCAAEEMKMLEEEERLRHVLNSREMERQQRLRTNREKQLKVQRSVAEAERNRRMFEEQTEQRFQESMLIAEQTRQFNAQHRRSGSYCLSRSGSQNPDASLPPHPTGFAMKPPRPSAEQETDGSEAQQEQQQQQE